MQTPSLSITGLRYLLQKKGWIDIPSSGTSMYPLIKEGDICRFIPLSPAEKINMGDIILFLSDHERLIGHRYIKSFAEGESVYCIFKGDMNAHPDPPVERSRLIGRLALIKKRSFHLNPDGMLPRLWGALVLAIPGFPRKCRTYLALQDKVRRWGKERRHA